MTFQPQQRLFLQDRQVRDLGIVTVTRVESNLVFGQFVAGGDYPAVAQLFAEYVEAANDQLFSVVGEMDTVIAGLGLHLHSPDGVSLPPIHDVQIGSGIITFRVGACPDAAAPSAPVESGSFPRSHPVS